MGGEIAFENGQISDFQGLVTVTLTLDRVILHTVMCHSSISTYIPNIIKIEETLCGWTNRRMYGQVDGHLRLGPLGRVDLIMKVNGALHHLCNVLH